LIETREPGPAVLDFFDREIAPLAERERAEQKSLFPLGFDTEAESYFVTPLRSVMAPADFELRATESPEIFVEELAALWTREGHSELALMASRLAELAREMATREQPEAEDLSPFMYAMF